MPVRLFHTIKHLFIPRTSNNHRPKILFPQSLSVLAAAIVIINSSIQSFAGISGGILGYASNITLDQVLTQTNQKRKEAGLAELKLNDQLSQAASQKAADMFTFDYWAHNNPQNGTTPWYFFDAASYKYRFAGENLARDFGTTEPMVQAWMDSPTHRDNLLSPKYQDTGIAVVNGKLGGMETTLVVQLFGTQQTSRALVPQAAAKNSQSAPKIQISPQPEVQSEHSTIQPFNNLALPRRLASLNRRSGQAGIQPSDITPLSISKAIAMSTLGLVALVLIIDSLIVWKNKTHRLAGRNWAHLVFISGLIIIIGLLNRGMIK